MLIETHWILRVILCNRQNRLEIEKIDFLETLPVFNFCRVMNKNAYIFFDLHPGCHGNRDFLFLAYFCIFFK